LDDISTGASNDIQRASAIARDMVVKYGMSDQLGPISYSSGNNEVFLGRDFAERQAYSEKVAATIDAEIHSIVHEAHEKCRTIISEHLDKLHEIADYLLEHEVMSAKEFYGLFGEDVPHAEE